jgi:ABC-type transport system involved in cytochrome c biogenesis ATPase subunit
MTDRVLLRGQELAVWRGERCLFEQLSFELGPAQLALLVGANGSGKTTLLRVLAGLGLPTAGSSTSKRARKSPIAATSKHSSAT